MNLKRKVRPADDDSDPPSTRKAARMSTGRRPPRSASDLFNPAAIVRDSRAGRQSDIYIDAEAEESGDGADSDYDSIADFIVSDGEEVSVESDGSEAASEASDAAVAPDATSQEEDAPRSRLARRTYTPFVYHASVDDCASEDGGTPDDSISTAYVPFVYSASLNHGSPRLDADSPPHALQPDSGPGMYNSVLADRSRSNSESEVPIFHKRSLTKAQQVIYLADASDGEGDSREGTDQSAACDARGRSSSVSSGGCVDPRDLNAMCARPLAWLSPPPPATPQSSHARPVRPLNSTPEKTEPLFADDRRARQIATRLEAAVQSGYSCWWTPDDISDLSSEASVFGYLLGEYKGFDFRYWKIALPKFRVRSTFAILVGKSYAMQLDKIRGARAHNEMVELCEMESDTKYGTTLKIFIPDDFEASAPVGRVVFLQLRVATLWAHSDKYLLVNSFELNMHPESHIDEYTVSNSDGGGGEDGMSDATHNSMPSLGTVSRSSSPTESSGSDDATGCYGAEGPLNDPTLPWYPTAPPNIPLVREWLEGIERIPDNDWTREVDPPQDHRLWCLLGRREMGTATEEEARLAAEIDRLSLDVMGQPGRLQIIGTIVGLRMDSRVVSSGQTRFDAPARMYHTHLNQVPVQREDSDRDDDVDANNQTSESGTSFPAV
ncbi:hypothetical protein C8R43DRAFT_947433 [Mycena crocata]|nr:hypothetical protein C8R43DRAFT_947433 [Mycena crocata]